jgi:plastocyanin
MVLRPASWTITAGFLAGSLAVLTARQAPLSPSGSIRGRVAAVTAPAPQVRPLVGALSAGPRDPIDRRRAVVYIDPAPGPALEDLPAGRARMDQRNEEFIPHVLAITVGTTVDFPNDDTKFHNVFSLSRVKPFDLGRYPVGHSKPVLFDKAGIVPISCDIHSHMSAYILVFNHPFFAVADEDGRFAITGVPPGVYTLKVWSEIGQADPRGVTVQAGQTAECDFRLERQK